MEFTPVDASNEDTAVRILSKAFSDDPVMNWSCNNPASLEPFFELTLESFTPHGLTYMDPGEGGAAAWLGPGETLKWSYNLSNIRKIFSLGGMTAVDVHGATVKAPIFAETASAFTILGADGELTTNND